MTILGIDPGSLKIGYAILTDQTTGDPMLITVEVNTLKGELPDRLMEIWDDVTHLCSQYQPDLVVVEGPFLRSGMKMNPHSLIVMAQVLGVVKVAARYMQMPVKEISPAECKQAASGNGNATKKQVAQGMSRQLKVQVPEGEAADSVAVALAAMVVREMPRADMRSAKEAEK